VATDLVERAFRDTYGIEMKDVFASEDLAVGTFRYAVSTTIPQMTQVRWEKKRDEIEKLVPNVQRNAFVYTYTRAQYEREFGTSTGGPDCSRASSLGRSRAAEDRTVQAAGIQDAVAGGRTPVYREFKAARERYRRLLQSVRGEPPRSAQHRLRYR
jgi:hypothetical protein